MHVICQFVSLSALICSLTHPQSLTPAQDRDDPFLAGQDSSRASVSLAIPISVPLPASTSDDKTVPDLRHCLQENEFHSLIYYSKKAVKTSIGHLQQNTSTK